MSIKHGYQPMHPPAKEVSQEEMWTKIAKHTRGYVQVSPVVASPKERSALEWLKPVRTGERSGYVQTVCGRYSISKDVVGPEIIYTAWRRVPGAIRGAKPYKEMPIHLGVSMKREKAEELCQTDADR
jgi:hypothetical protein